MLATTYLSALMIVHSEEAWVDVGWLHQIQASGIGNWVFQLKQRHDKFSMIETPFISNK